MISSWIITLWMSLIREVLIYKLQVNILRSITLHIQKKEEQTACISVQYH